MTEPTPSTRGELIEWVAAQAAAHRSLELELQQSRQELDRRLIAAYRTDTKVKVTHLANAAGLHRDTVHTLVKPYVGNRGTAQ